VAWVFRVLKSHHLVAVALGVTPAAAVAEGKPNVLMVLCDDLGFSDLGCYGSEIPTPQIDSLARQGLRFTSMGTSARCCPTRASLLTGLYPAQAGIPNFNGNLSEKTATIAEVLKGNGYATSMAGKWHVGTSAAASPTARGFDEFYGYTDAHSHDQWNPDKYQRLPEGRVAELSYEPGKFYATDVFTDYALEFMRQAQRKESPWFVYLAHSAPHFPVQAPAASTAAFVATYRKGWDVLRADRFQKLRDIGLIDHGGWELSPRSLVPVEANHAIANGFSGQPNPAWESLDHARREDLAHRMAIYAAMIKHVDDGIGRIVRYLKEAGAFENTIILLTSDNGACYEWGPFGFDGVSRAGATILHEGASLATMGTTADEMSYGSAWANLSNTPFRLYKHFTHEGGITSPCVIHWPAGIRDPDRWVRDPVHVMDLLPTLVDVTGATYPKQRNGRDVQPMEGVSLAPVLRSGAALAERAICYQHQGARAIRKGAWKLVFGKRFPTAPTWELYNLKADPVECHDLAAAQPERVAELTKAWEQWAQRTGSIPREP
jgi:arylsulfatase A-like enzyme